MPPPPRHHYPWLTRPPFPHQLSSTLRIRVPKPGSYHETKQAAVEYHTAKQTLIKAFHKAGLGAWVKKPIEQDQFSLNSWEEARL